MNWWDVNLPKWTGDNFRSINPERVLVEYDGLLTFTFRDASGNLMLAHLADASGSRSRYIVAPTSELGIRRLVNGTASLRNTLNQPIIWLLEYDGENVTDSWSGNLDQLPNRVLPLDDAMLYAHLEPLIKLRAPGDQFRLGAVATNALTAMVASAENAISRLIGHVDASQAAMYQVEAQQLQFNSIEIAFQATRKDQTYPMFGEADTTLPRVEILLSEGLKWIASDGNYALPAADESVILTAIHDLSPKQGGPIPRLEISGRATNEIKSVTLTHDVRRKINTRIKTPRANAISPIGRIRELDLDSLTFDLRDILEGAPQNATTIRYEFIHDQREEVHRLFRSESYVRAEGEKESQSRYRLIDLTTVEK